MYEIDKKKFGAFVAGLRREKGYTQKELADKLFLSDKAVSKWETGVSIPDTAMLVPLAEILGVSVTELLMCQTVEKPMACEQVEQVVKTAIRYSDEDSARNSGRRAAWKGIYFLALVICGVLVFVNSQTVGISQCLITACGLSSVFGFYYCFLAKTRLPSYYDEHKISGMSDGIFRMNIPGVYFNNSNWPHILNVIRIWTCTVMTCYPIVTLIFGGFFWWRTAELYVFLTLLLGGLFVPAYIVAKKYQ